MQFCQTKRLTHPEFAPSKWYNIPDDNGFTTAVDINCPVLIGFTDAAHANDLYRRQLTTGIVFIFCGDAIVWKPKTQSLTAGSTTEAELFAAYKAGQIC